MYIEGCLYHVIQRGNNREACFFQDADYAFYLQKLKEASDKYKVRVHAFVLMTNHVLAGLVNFLGSYCMKRVLSVVVFVMGASIGPLANAAWLNTSGTVDRITTYYHRETVLIRLSSNGVDVPACSNNTTFAISKDISPEARARMFAMLLSAQATGREVTVTYSDAGSCESWDSNPSAYRRILRLS
jgi:hypothetical protein